MACVKEVVTHGCQTSLDEDIPTTTTTSPTLHDEQANQIRLGPVTRARAKLLEQQVNLLLLESDDRFSENYILPKSLCVCMIRYQGEDKELGGAEVQEEEAKEQGQATWEEEPQERHPAGLRRPHPPVPQAASGPSMA